MRGGWGPGPQEEDPLRGCTDDVALWFALCKSVYAIFCACHQTSISFLSNMWERCMNSYEGMGEANATSWSCLGFVCRLMDDKQPMFTSGPIFRLSVGTSWVKQTNWGLGELCGIHSQSVPASSPVYTAMSHVDLWKRSFPPRCSEWLISWVTKPGGDEDGMD